MEKEDILVVEDEQSVEDALINLYLVLLIDV